MDRLKRDHTEHFTSTGGADHSIGSGRLDPLSSTDQEVSALVQEDVEYARKEYAEDDEAEESKTVEDLPEDILENVLSRLGRVTLIRLHASSRRWKTIIEEVKCPNSAPCFLLRTRSLQGTPILYDIVDKSWHGTSNSIFITHKIVCATNGYLMLEDKPQEFVVMKPLLLESSRPLRVVPRMAGKNPKLHLLRTPFLNFLKEPTLLIEKENDILDPIFKVMVHQIHSEASGFGVERTDSGKFSVYDSEADAWEPDHEFMPRRYTLSGDPVMLRGSLYYLTKTTNHDSMIVFNDRGVLRTRSRKFDLVMYNLECRESVVLQSQMPPDPFSYILMFKNRSKLMLFGVYLHYKDGKEIPVYEMAVWQLDEESMVWLEVHRVPVDVVKDFLRDKPQYTTCCSAASGDYIGMIAPQNSLLLVCNLLENCSTLVPMPRYDYSLTFRPWECKLFML